MIYNRSWYLLCLLLLCSHSTLARRHQQTHRQVTNSTVPVLVYQDALHRDSLAKISPDSPMREFAHDMGQVFSEISSRQAQVGFIVTSARTQEVLAERDADMLMNPASNIKLLTTAAALSILTPDYRFKTEYYLDGTKLYVKGYGDPSIVSERLQKVAHELELRGVQRLTGVYLDTSYFDSNNEPKGFDKFRTTLNSYAAPIGVLSFNHNVAQFVVRPTQANKPAFWSVEPSVNYFQVEGNIETSSKNKYPQFRLINAGDKMRIIGSGYVGEKSNYVQIRRRIFNPEQYFGTALAYYLQQEGIELTNSNVVRGIVPSNAKLTYVDKSPTLTQIVADANKYSSNFIAEMLVKAIGAKTAVPATFENGLSSIRQFLVKSVGLVPGSFTLVNGSGLSEGNRFSARQFAKVLAYANHNFEIASEFMGSLGVAGSLGTLSKRMRDTEAEGRLRAKTGTLNHVSALSGYVATRNEDTLIFSILVSGREVPSYKISRLQDRIGGSLAHLKLFSTDKEVYQGNHGSDVEMDEDDADSEQPGG